jgi:hypothetical protein
MPAPKGKDAIEFLEGLPAGYIALQCNRGLYDGRNAAAAGARR